MKKKISFLIAVGVALVALTALWGCSNKVEKPVEAPIAAYKFTLEPLNSPLTFELTEGTSAKEGNPTEEVKELWISSLCSQNRAHIERLLKEIISVQGKHTLNNTLEPLNEIDIALERMLGISELMANTHPDAIIREAAEMCTEYASKLMTQININPVIYAAVNDVDTSKLDAPAKRFVEKTLQDFKLSGVDKDEATRKKLADLDAAIVKSGQDFDRNIRDDKKTLKVTPEELDGLAEDFIKSHEPDADGKLTITTDYTDLFPVLKYAKNEKVRADLTKLSSSRAYPANEEVFKNLLKQRYEYATLLGFPNWAAYNASNKMAKDTQTIESFIKDIATITKPRSDEEIKEIMDLKKAEHPDADGFYPWDRFYYTEMLKRQKFDFDAQAAKQYFAYDKVKRGILSVASQIYGVSFRQSESPVWHSKVEAYDVYEGDNLIARFYLDMHPREGKYGHAASFGIYSGIEGLQLPTATLVCNFPEPTPSNPGYMEHSDVETFFHEFGHLLHQLFAGRHHWAKQSGISCEWDFVEAPSQLFEDWAWDYDVLKMFATNDKGEVIPKELVEKMKKSEDVGKGMFNMRQISFAALSYIYHSQDPANIDVLKTMNDVYAQYSPFKAFEGDYSFASFGHLNGYSSMYYTYMWSLAIAKDLAIQFNEKGHLDADTARKYRSTILAPGGALPAKDLVHNFLGRDYNLDAFKQWLSE